MAAILGLVYQNLQQTMTLVKDHAFLRQDVPLAIESSEADAIAPSLFVLPPELRNMVYEYLLAGYYTKEIFLSPNWPSPKPKPSEWAWDRLSILLTNRQVFEEASAVFYHKSTFCFNFGLFHTNHRSPLNKRVADRIRHLSLTWDGLFSASDRRLDSDNDASFLRHLIDPNVSRGTFHFDFRGIDRRSSDLLVSIVKHFRRTQKIVVEEFACGWPHTLDSRKTIRSLEQVLGPVTSRMTTGSIRRMSLEFQPSRYDYLPLCDGVTADDAWEDLETRLGIRPRWPSARYFCPSWVQALHSWATKP